jgi:hypothetical protein
VEGPFPAIWNREEESESSLTTGIYNKFGVGGLALSSSIILKFNAGFCEAEFSNIRRSGTYPKLRAVAA